MPPPEDIAAPVEEELAEVDIPSIEAVSTIDAALQDETSHLKNIARTLRRDIVNMLYAAGSGHPGGSLSAADLLTVLYFHTLRHNPFDPKWPERDRFILSKGHAAPVLYAALAEAGYFPVEALLTLRKLGSMLQGHADCKSTPGVEISSGSLGQGLSFGVGTALAAKLDSQPQRVYVLLGDGECDEGQIWEAAMAAAQYRLDNLVAIIDRNRIQSDGFTAEIMKIGPLRDKWLSFGWHTLEIDGHDYQQIIHAFEQARLKKDQPTAVIARTIKGKGVGFMENNPAYHGKTLTLQEKEDALADLA